MSISLEQLSDKYPDAHAWAFGDSAELADRLVIAGKKVASCIHGRPMKRSRRPAAIASFSM